MPQNRGPISLHLYQGLREKARDLKPDQVWARRWCWKVASIFTPPPVHTWVFPPCVHRKCLQQPLLWSWWAQKSICGSGSYQSAFQWWKSFLLMSNKCFFLMTNFLFVYKSQRAWCNMMKMIMQLSKFYSNEVRDQSGNFFWCHFLKHPPLVGSSVVLSPERVRRCSWPDRVLAEVCVVSGSVRQVRAAHPRQDPDCTV